MQRQAQCSCGELKIRVDGDPHATIVCNCTNCQKRTGSAFGVGAYFKDEAVIETTGETRVFQHLSDAGKALKRSFCPNCGSTVFWTADFQPGFTGVAVGCFTDPNFPEPTASCWNKSKLNWVCFPDQWMNVDKQDRE